jgi:hypothetical protein
MGATIDQHQGGQKQKKSKRKTGAKSFTALADEPKQPQIVMKQTQTPDKKRKV